jgi:SAM-dependent methyltransferase
MKFTEKDLEIVRCNLCNSSYSDSELWTKKDGINIIKCKKCGLVFSNPRLNKEALDRYYSEQYFKEGDYNEDKLREKSYIEEIKEIINIVGNKGQFLDVGAAYGKFLTMLPNTFEKFGLEYSKDAVESGNKMFNLNLKQGILPEAGYEEKFFDVVHFRGVIEHLRNPNANIKEANKILKDNGWLIFNIVPNIDGPVGRRFKEKFRLVFPQEHIYYFSPKTLTKMLEKNGFKVKKITYPYLNTPYANPIKNIIEFIVNKPLGKDSPPFWKNIMTFYAQKRLK